MIIAIDVSGSTSKKLRIRSYNDPESIFSAEKKIAKLIENYFSPSDDSVSPSTFVKSMYLGWDDEAFVHQSLEDVVLNGRGTDPKSLYDNSVFTENMNTQHIVLFTDGVIDSSDIANFYDRMSTQNTKAVFTFCIVGNEMKRVEEVDVSVAFPIISLARKAIFLYYDPYACKDKEFTPRVLHTIGLGDVTIPEITEGVEWSSFPYLTDTNMNCTETNPEFSRSFENHHVPIPSGKIRLEEKEYNDVVGCHRASDEERHAMILSFQENDAYILATFIYKCRCDTRPLINILKTCTTKFKCEFSKKWLDHVSKLNNHVGSSSRVFSCSR
jgi:hypothetical protein